MPTADPVATIRSLGRSAPARRALGRRAAALAAALALALWVHHQHDEALGLRQRWDPTVPVVVAKSTIRAGAVVSPADLTVERRPAALVPDGALTTKPRGPRRAAVDLAAREAVVADRLQVGGTVAAKVPEGHSAVTLAVEGGLPPVEPGDRVDVLAARRGTRSPDLSSAAPDSGTTDPGTTDPGTTAVATGAIVVDVPGTGAGGFGAAADPGGGHSLTVAVADGDVRAVTAALLAGPVAVVLRSPAGP